MRTINGTANTIGTYEVFFWRLQQVFACREKLPAVTKEDVQRVAQNILAEQSRLPYSRETSTREGKANEQCIRAMRFPASAVLALGLAFSAFAQTLKLPPHEKVVLKNGLTLLLMEKRGVPM